MIARERDRDRFLSVRSRGILLPFSLHEKNFVKGARNLCTSPIQM